MLKPKIFISIKVFSSFTLLIPFLFDFVLEKTMQFQQEKSSNFYPLPSAFK